MTTRKLANDLGLGDITLGHRPLVNEPLTKEDWAEVKRATIAYQHHLKLIVLEARKREVIKHASVS